MNSHGERQDGMNLDQIDPLHKDRYQWAIDRTKGIYILDCACGGGYGSYMIANTFPNAYVFGVDISEEAIEHAKTFFQASNAMFLVDNMIRMEMETQFNTIISLETLEHVEDPTIVLGKFKSLLSAGGQLIVSMPSIPMLNGFPFHKFAVNNMDEATHLFESNGFFVRECMNQDGRFGLFQLEVV